MNKEQVMEKWDYIRQLIKEDRGSLPRDIFESIIDKYEEEKETLESENAFWEKELTERNSRIGRMDTKINYFKSEATRLEAEKAVLKWGNAELEKENTELKVFKKMMFMDKEELREAINKSENGIGTLLKEAGVDLTALAQVKEEE